MEDSIKWKWRQNCDIVLHGKCNRLWHLKQLPAVTEYWYFQRCQKTWTETSTNLHSAYNSIRTLLCTSRVDVLLQSSCYQWITDMWVGNTSLLELSELEKNKHEKLETNTRSRSHNITKYDAAATLKQRDYEKCSVHQKLRLLSERIVYVGLHPRMADIQPAEYIVSHLS